MSMQHLKSRLDFASLECITKENVQQAIETAYPFERQGFILAGPSAPDVVTNPELEFFFWSKTDGSFVQLGEIYYYNGTSWTLFALIDGSRLANGSVTLNKLSLTGSSPYYIIQVNSAGTALIWTSIIDAIQNGTLPLNKLQGINDANKYVATSLSNVVAFTLLSTFFSTTVDNNTIPVDKLIRAGANTLKTWLSTKVDGSAVEWSTIDIANIAAAGATGGYGLKRNAGNTAWEFYLLPTGADLKLTVLNNAGAYYAIPASAGVLVVPHTLAVRPIMTRVTAINVTPVDGYVADDEVEISGLVADLSGGDDSESAAFNVCTDGTNITIASSTYTQGIVYAAKTGGLILAFDITKWKFKIYLLSL